MRDTFTTTVDAAAAVAREDAESDRPTLAELAGEDAPRCSVCGLQPTWVDEGDPCDACEAEA